MKKRRTLTTIVAALGLILATSVCGQQRPSQGDDSWGYNSPYGRIYNPATEEIISGSVENINLFAPFKGMARGVHLLVKTNGELVAVHLGPFWFITKQSVQVAVGDKVEIIGSLVSFDGQPVVIARKVRKDSGTLKLRNQSGVPLWSRGWRKNLP